jgi:hypothetical protein
MGILSDAADKKVWAHSLFLNQLFGIYFMNWASKRIRSLSQSLFPIVFLITLCSAQNTASRNIVADISDKDSITFTELLQYVKDFSYNILYKSKESEGFNKALETMIINRAKVIDFFARRLNEKKELFNGIRRTINEELVIKYYQNQFYEKYINEHVIQKAYREMGREIVFQQIILPQPKNSSVKHINSLKVFAGEIKAEMDKGTGFEEIKKMFSKDVVFSQKKDDKLVMNWEASLSSELNRQIFEIPSGQSRIIESSKAIYVIRVFKINVKDVPPFEKVNDQILHTLEKAYSDISVREFDSTKKNFINEKTAKWNRKGLDQLIKWSNIPGFYQKYYKDTIQNAILQNKNFLILTYSNGKVDLKEYLRLLDEILIPGKYTSLKEIDLKNFIFEALRTNVIVKKADKMDLEKKIVNAHTNNPIIRNDIIRLYNEQVIENQIPPATQDALHRFYNENKDSLFYQFAKVNIYAIIDTAKNTLEELKRKLDRNVPFEKLKNSLFVKTFIKDREGNIKSYFSLEQPFLGEAAFTLMLNQVAGPIEYNDPNKGKQYALIKCIGWQEEKQLLYQDVEKTIKDTFIKKYREKLAQATQDMLKKKYHVIIYTDVLNQNLRSIGINPQ